MTFTPLTKQSLIDEIERYSNGTSQHMDMNKWDVSNITMVDLSSLFGNTTVTFNVTDWVTDCVKNMCNDLFHAFLSHF
jgi:hypothetical protein